ncbi:hypothetical protein AB0B45_11795 [Nonomuraea sp. NPDC049152]|uniref:hypothetical protein n=1 Tax=Nonomuraea sp. NPDC049152 TaxID=3154350 RepID=UPI00340ADE71
MTRVTPRCGSRKGSFLLWSSANIGTTKNDPRLREAVGDGGGHPRNHPRIPQARDLPARLGAVFRWRTEAAVAGLLSMAAAQVAAWTNGLTAGMAVVGVALACTGTPYVRREIVGQAVAVIVRHRFQGLAKRTSMRTEKGRLPLVLRMSVEGTSVLLLLGLRSGLSLELLEDYAAEIRTACLAQAVVFYRHPANGGLVTMEVVQPWGL